MGNIDLSALNKDFELDANSYKLINYINLSSKDSTSILEMRNHGSIRERMINSDPISNLDHDNFIISLKNKTAGYWALKKGNTILGSISLVNYNENENSFIGGNFISPELIGSGFGSVINYYMHYVAFEKIGCSTIKAVVKKNNKNALRINYLFGARNTVEKNLPDTDDEYQSIEFDALNWLSKIKTKTRKLINHVL
ncbi:GNAT family N-acetyltransferase [Mariniflexile sp.]|uniref:GNAT family N-acetyltransferase n=1 Tax=Mariniflexile sp. TaxID=1979402 RepID=UPI004047A48D